MSLKDNKGLLGLSALFLLIGGIAHAYAPLATMLTATGTMVWGVISIILALVLLAGMLMK